MIINLSRSFHFQKDQKEYEVDYIFKNEVGLNSLSLVLDISVNAEKKITHTLNKPTSTLYQSNELIEKMIADEIVSISR